MSETHDGLEVLVASGDGPFGGAVVEAVDGTEGVASARHVEPTTDSLDRVTGEAVDAAVVDGQTEEPAAVVERLTDEWNLPVVVLAEAPEVVARAVEAGAADVFPRVQAETQCELVVDCLAGAADGETSGVPTEGPYREVLDEVSDGLVIHEPETGEILDVNEQFCEMTGYSREAVLEMGVEGLSVPEEGYDMDRARELIGEVLETDESRQFEWAVRTSEGGTRWLSVRGVPATVGGRQRYLSLTRDITERKRREREFDRLFDGVNDAIAIHDADTGTLVRVNRRLCELTGYDREQLLEMGAEGLVRDHPDQDYGPEEIPSIVDRVVAGETVDPYEQALETSDGDTVWVEVNPTRAVIDGEQRFVAISRDITERRRREREYEEIFDGVNDAIVVFEPETGAFLQVNDSYRELFGYDDIETIRELGIGGLSADEEEYTGERGARLIREVSESGESTTVEWRGKKRDGEEFWLEATLAPAEIGGEQRVLSIHRDITERRELERMYGDIFEGVSDGLLVHDPETGDILEVNDRYCELTGYSREELLEGNIGLIVPDDPEYTREDALERIRRARTEGPQLFEFTVQRKDGDPFVGEISLRTIELRGEQRVLASVRDITERKRREQEYEQIFNGVNDAIAVWDPDTLELLDVNDAYLEMFGYETIDQLRTEGVSGLSVTEEGYTERRGREIHQRVAETGQPETVEWRGETRDGERVWNQVKVTPAVIGGQQRTVSIQRDITERKRREQMVRRLHDATERLQEAETIEVACQTAVDAAREVLELPLTTFWLHRERADGPVLEPVAATEPVQDVDPSPFRPGDREYEAFRDGEMLEYDPSERFPENPLDAALVLPVGDHGLLGTGAVDVEAYDEFVVDAARTLAGHVRTALDRVERAREVRESERRFRLIAERIDEVIYLAEPDFSEMLYVNPAYEEVYGQPVETLYDDTTAFLEAIDERDRSEFVDRFEAMLAEIEAGDPDESYDFEFRLRQPTGEVRWVHATGYAVELPGENPRFVGIVEDITERKRREQRLEVFNRILRHNLRNQLDVIRSHAEALTDRTTDEHAERIVAAVDELGAIGTRARKTDRIMSMDETPTELDLSVLLSQTVEAMGSMVEDVTVTTEMPDRATLCTHEDAVTIAVESALENALEYADSTVLVSLERVQNGHVVIIDDDGPGIPKEELIPIETGTETNLQHGRGLGLWQLRWSVDKLNGQLSFDTANGTTVRITIPDGREQSRADR
jgi:PAS domain S-box-containing protein